MSSKKQTDKAVVRDSEPSDTVTLDMGAPEPPPAPEPTPEPLPAEELPEDVPVPNSADLPRTPKYRVLKSKVMHWRAQELRFTAGEVFGLDTHGPAALENFVKEGLELEQIE